MARSRRTLDRRALRADNEAAERRKTDDEVDETEGEEDEDEEADEEEEAGASDAEEEGDEEEEEKPKKKKAPAKPKAAKPRTRTPKVTRMKVVWGVFNNSNVRVATYEYRQKPEAEEHAARLSTEKKSTHFVQPVKEAIEEKKEA